MSKSEKRSKRHTPEQIVARSARRHHAAEESPGRGRHLCPQSMDALNVYVTDCALAMDNNLAERAVKPFAIGRNYAESGAMRSCGLVDRIFRPRSHPQLRII